jgi:hypothetical protein
VHNRAAGRHGAGPLSMQFTQLVMRMAAPPVRLQQHPLDDLGIDVVGFEVFDGRHGIAAFLDRNAVIDDVTPAQVLALGIRDGDRLGVARMLVFSHCVRPYRS